jgi:hypothetical protein
MEQRPAIPRRSGVAIAAGDIATMRFSISVATTHQPTAFRHSATLFVFCAHLFPAP